MAAKTILLTGCSQGGLGDALALAFHARGHRVIATARDPAKMAHYAGTGIETEVLDVVSLESITQCVAAVSRKTNGQLDILVNNSGGGYTMPLADASLTSARSLFELNVWAVLAVTQAFLPLLLKSTPGAVVANNTSIVSVLPLVHSGIYNASKAAVASLTDTLRLELAPFGIKVIDLKTGSVKSRFFDNRNTGTAPTLPADSIYEPARDAVQKSMSGVEMQKSGVESTTWARQVVGALLSSSPPTQIWKGGDAWLIWFARRFLPFTALDGSISKMGGLNVLRKNLAVRSKKAAM